jgi:putative transposase
MLCGNRTQIFPSWCIILTADRKLGSIDRLAELGIAPSVGSHGDSYDYALAEAVNAAYKTELINRGKPWRGIDDLELSTAEWMAWYNQERLHEALGNVPPAEYEAALTGTSHPASQPTPALATD